MRFVAEQKKLLFGKYHRGLLGHNRFPFDKDSAGGINPGIGVAFFTKIRFRLAGCLYDLFRILCGNLTVVLRHIGISDPLRQVDLVNLLSFLDKMIRRIHMRSVVRAHFDGRQIASRALALFKHDNALRRRIPGIHGTAEYFLGNVINLYRTVVPVFLA